MRAFYPFLFLFLFLHVCIFSNAQNVPRDNNHLFFQVSIKEVDLGYIRKFGNFGFGGKVGYVYPLSRSMTIDRGNELTDFPKRIVFFSVLKGLNTELIFNFLTFSDGSLMWLSGGFNNLKSGLLIADEGASGGCNTCDYSEFYDEINSYFIKYNCLIHAGNNIFFNLNLGMGFRYVTRNYSLGGSYSNPVFSDKVEKFQQRKLIADIGLLYIYNF